ncbi:MAG: tetratricopeptide repeat protein [Planctomycetes bacterium]|nr:tetratricopeptide repeat protein [Planctomycetota bacterium]
MRLTRLITPRRLLAGLFFLATVPASAGQPAPLPPPPELLDGNGYAIDQYGQPVAPAYQQPVTTAAVAAGAGQRGFIVSPPSATMPDDYFDLPLVQEGIPGVVLPEMDENFVDPGLSESRRPRAGLAGRQLEPFFDYAKTFEKDALAARTFNDENTYRTNLQNAIDAYMEIIAMADAGTEAREEAWYGVARCEYRLGNWWRSFDALERSFPERFDRREVEGRIRLEMFIGERLWRIGYAPAPGATRNNQTLNGYQAAALVYAAAIFNQPNNRDAPLALLRRGDAAAMNNDWPEAAKFYRSGIEYYPESEPAMQARSSLAEAVIRQDWPAGFPEAAREDLSTIMAPVENAERRLSPAAEERRQRAAVLANDREASEKLMQAKGYLHSIKLKKSRDAAIFLLRDVVSQFPPTMQAQEAAAILRNLGETPPATVADGSRYPLTGIWPEEEYPLGNAGSVRLGGQNTKTLSGQPGVEARERSAAPTVNYTPTPGSSYHPSLAPLDLNVPGVMPGFE